jgi:peptidoglycan/xylan/chitin deacetylase (PgdA/CDA1 family)
MARGEASTKAVPILMYHEVSPTPHPRFRRYTVTVRQFQRHMRWLAALGYRTITMDALVGARRDGATLPKHPVLITFDDGFQGCADYAVPVLIGHGFTAVLYLVAGCMGGTSRWLGPELDLELPVMPWDTARSLAAAGFQCAAHTVTHPRLTQLDAARCRAELADGRARIEDELGHPIVHLAYPFGSYDPTVRQMAAEAGYVTACSTRAGLSDAGDDLLGLHRVSVYGHESLFDFACRLRSGAGVRERVARALGRRTDGGL